MGQVTGAGVPRALEMDGWWLTTEVTEYRGADGGPAGGWRTVAEGPRGRRLALLAALIVAADVLFYGHAPGLSLAVFAGLVFAASVAGTPVRRLAGPAAAVVLGALPVIDYLQALSVAFLVAGLAIGAAWARVGPGPVERTGAAALRLLRALPLGGVRAAYGALRRSHLRLVVRGSPTGKMRNWAFPLGGSLILGSLLAEANPILLDWALRVLSLDIDLGPVLRRGAFWAGIGLVVWPVLFAEVAEPAERVRRWARPGLAVFGINAGSVANALGVFNAILAVQTLMDLRYLWAGGALPEGLSYATYAHKGAYPLLASALLAGAFALAARPFLDERRGLRALMMLWIGQNVLLTISAVYRLAIYVEVYGLTYLRVHAGIWMALVAAGLMLTGWQIWCRRSNRWLLVRSAGLGLGVLYLSAFVNFAQVIAAHNLAQSRGPDLWYLCLLPATAAPAIHASGVVLPCCAREPQIDGWRDWGFREWRAQRYLVAEKASERAHEDPCCGR